MILWDGCQVWDPYLMCLCLFIQQVIVKYVLSRGWSYGGNFKKDKVFCFLGSWVPIAEKTINKQIKTDKTTEWCDREWLQGN